MRPDKSISIKQYRKIPVLPKYACYSLTKTMSDTTLWQVRSNGNSYSVIFSNFFKKKKGNVLGFH